MITDTAGNKIYEPIQNCSCGLTGGCANCNPTLYPKYANKNEEIEFERDVCDKCGIPHWKR